MLHLKKLEKEQTKPKVTRARKDIIETRVQVNEIRESNLFVDDIILYTENPKVKKKQNQLELIYSQQSCKIQNQQHKNQLHSYTLTMNNQKKKNTIPFRVASKRIKY